MNVWFNRARCKCLAILHGVLIAALLCLSVPAAAETVKILAFGDSLSAGYGLEKPVSFTAQLQAALRGAGEDVVVINGGVSGDTSAGGRARLAWALADKP
ncbi:MAG: arylesterase, partial [Rhodospirillaceae bacterium]|nr:arylesterase [Rhodospirillaceae bacterium]